MTLALRLLLVGLIVAALIYNLGLLLWIVWPRKFSLRQLFITTTAVAVGLGLLVMMLRGS